MIDQIDTQAYKDLLDKFNPFGFKEPDGKSSVFSNYGELYYYVMEKIVTTFPRGYIDIDLFIVNEMKCSIADAEKIFHKYFRQCFHHECVLIELWNESSRERDNFFRDLLFCFHATSETTFNVSYFKDAINKFNERNSKLALSERTIDGSILNPVAKIQ